MNDYVRRRESGICEGLLVLCLGCTQAEFVPITTDAADAPGPADAGVDQRPAGDALDADSLPDSAPTCPAPSVPGCLSLSSGICDPVCQTGACDWCAQKCSYLAPAGGGAPEPVCTRKGKGTFPDPCTVSPGGAPLESDGCDAGSICLAPVIGDSSAYCFGLCRSGSDCLYGSACGQRRLSAAGGSVSVCDPPYDQCGPDGTCCDPFTNRGCDAKQVCLLVPPDLGTGHSRTVCEFSYGDGRDGASCVSARDCQVGYTCVGSTCRRVCGSAAPCQGVSTCISFGIEFGWCN